jgi:2-keto-3-deoxy-L-rhamnonate aldolase RhmA
MTTYGLWLAIPEPLVVEAAARAKPDWVGLDMQHGGWDLNTAFRAIQLLDALGMPALVRVSEQQLDLMPRVLDHGASGIVIAMASEPGLMEEAVRRVRYQPEGIRSFGGQRYGMRQISKPTAEIRPHVYPMIEDSRGVAAVEAIAAVKGIAGLHVGPVDLGLGLGVGHDDPRYVDALKRIVAAGNAAKVPVTMHAVRGENAAKWERMGFRDIVLTADIELLRGAFEAHVKAARGGTAA